MKYTTEIVNAALAKAAEAMRSESIAYRIEHGDAWHACGFASITGLSGQKRTLVKLLKEQSAVSRHWHRGYNVQINASLGHGSQNVDFHERVKQAACNVLNKELELDLYVESRLD